MEVSVLHIDGPWLPTNGSESFKKPKPVKSELLQNIHGG